MQHAAFGCISFKIIASADFSVSIPQKQPAGGGIYAVRLLILMLKKTNKKAHEGKVTAYHTADGKGLFCFVF